MWSLTLLYPVRALVAGMAAVSVDAHHFLQSLSFLQLLHNQLDVTSVVYAKLYGAVEYAIGDYLIIEYPSDRTDDDLYNYEWEQVKNIPNKFRKYNYDVI